MQKGRSPISKDVPLEVAGSSTYGRDPKILACRTFNMIMSDGWFVEYGGFKRILEFAESSGRGIFSSTPGNRMIIVVYNFVYSITASSANQYFGSFVGELSTFYGDVFIDENNTGQIAICDRHQLWIYKYNTGDFIQATLPAGVIPNYVSQQNGRFIVPDALTNLVYLSAIGDGLNFFWSADGNPVALAIQTKPDRAVAAVRAPGKGNLLLVMGKTVTELWVDVGGALLPYQKSTSSNIDYGVLSAGTIACSDNFCAWLGINEKSGPVIIVCSGTNAETISTDGINYKLSQVVEPENSCGFFVKLAGHLIYQLTFYGDNDNFSLIYDFTTKKFFDVSNEEMNYHPARRAAFFNNDYFFVSLRSGDLYQLSASYSDYDYGDGKIKEIPRVRICNNIRMPDSSRFIVNRLTFTMEQGTDYTYQQTNPDYQPRLVLRNSRDGGVSFGSDSAKEYHVAGFRLNRFDFWNQGSANDYVAQFRFYGRGPWKCNNGLASIYQ